MKINTLKLVNWGPYVDSHVIDLSVTDSAPVVVFYAENGHGKTSILSALKWCLYGKTIYKNDGRSIRSLESLINLESLQGGAETPFEVSINLEHLGAEYELTRAGSAVQAIDGNVKITSLSVTLKPKDGPPFAQQDIEERVNSILNEEVSEFFLFDGEMLGRFEERLKETDTSRVFVRKQVERALGLPFIDTLLGDFDAVEAQANKVIEASNRKNKKTEQARNDFAEKTEKLAGHVEDIAAVTKVRDDLIDEIDALSEQLEKVEPIRELFLEQTSTEKRLGEAESDLTDIEDELKALLEDAWWFPLEDKLREEHDKLQTEWEDAQTALTRRIELEYQIKNLNDLLNSDTCTTCGQKLPDHDEAHIHKEISKAELALAEMPNGSKSDELMERIRKLRKFANRASSKERIASLEVDIRKAKFRMDKDKQRLRTIQEQLSGDRVDVAALDSQLRFKKLKRDEAQIALNGLEEISRKLRNEINEISKDLRNSPDVETKDRELLNLADAAEDIIRQAFTSFSDEMRGRVEEHATHLFRRLSNEKEYESVKISEDYSLKVLTSDRRTDNATVELSAGFNQVLTVSFIGALGECSVDEAPLVMDTPFSRLDVGHRRAILEWVSEYEPQVILFTHSGEMVRETDREYLRNSIGREYTVQRLSAFSSVVRKV